MTGQHPDTERSFAIAGGSALTTPPPPSGGAGECHVSTGGRVRKRPASRTASLSCSPARIAAAAAILAIAVSGLYLYGRNRGTSPIAHRLDSNRRFLRGRPPRRLRRDLARSVDVAGPATSPATAGWRRSTASSRRRRPTGLGHPDRCSAMGRRIPGLRAGPFRRARCRATVANWRTRFGGPAEITSGGRVPCP